jgi:hypothetical protein
MLFYSIPLFMKLFFLSPLLFVSMLCQSQSFLENTFAEAGYTYFNGNLIKLGAKHIIKETPISLGIYGYLGNYNNKTILIPEANATVYIGGNDFMKASRGFLPFARVGLSPKTVTPEIGISLFTLIEISGGYGIKTNNTTLYNPEGLRLNFAVAFPLKFHLKLM